MMMSFDSIKDKINCFIGNLLWDIKLDLRSCWFTKVRGYMRPQLSELRFVEFQRNTQ